MKLKTIFLILGLGTLYSSYMAFALVFTKAFINGIQNGVWQSGININVFNEAIPEFIWLIFTFPIIVYLFFLIVEKIREIEHQNSTPKKDLYIKKNN